MLKQQNDKDQWIKNMPMDKTGQTKCQVKAKIKVKEEQSK